MRRTAAAACSMLLHAAVLSLPLVQLLAWSSQNFGGGVPFVELSAVEPARLAVSSGTSRAEPRQARAATRSVPPPALSAPHGPAVEPVGSPAATEASARAPQAREIAELTAEPPLPALEFVGVASARADVPTPERQLGVPAAAPAKVARLPEPEVRKAAEPAARVPAPSVQRPAAPDDDGPGAPPTPLQRALAQLRAAAEDATMTVRAEVGPFAAPGPLFEFLLDRPELAAHLVRELKLGRYRVSRSERGLVLDDGWGSRIGFVISTPAPGLRVLSGEARHEQAFVPEITGQVTMVIEYQIAPGPAGDVVTASVTSHARIDGEVGQLLARIAGAAIARKADREAHRFVRTFARLAQQLAADPDGALALLERWPERPREDVEALATLLGRAAPAATAR